MTSTTLASRLWPTTQSSSLLRNGALAVLGTMIVAAAAHINVPMLPVPMTLQTLAVLAIGAAFGARMGAATLALYALEGAAGLPVFTPTADGYPGIMGPTGGYIVGFILAAAVVGWFAERGKDRNVIALFGVMLLGAVVLYLPGLAWLHGFVGSWEKTFQFGLAPFWMGDVVKAAIASLGFPAIWSLLGRKA